MVATTNITTPPTPPVSPAAAALLDEARRALQWRPFFQGLCPSHQDAKALEVARWICLSRSPVGVLAAAVSTKFDEFLDAIEAFTKVCPDPGDTEAEARKALEAAGLLTLKFGPTWNYGDYQPDHYRGVHATVEALGKVLSVLCPSLDDLDPPTLQFEREGGAS